MGMKRFALGIGIGLAVGYLLSNKLENDNITPERALKLVKHSLENNKININGSWIHMIPEDFEKNNLTYTVYRGGVTTLTDDGSIQYDFMVDTKTGTIIHLDS
ncbi:PepSY domain-containing protein [Bacillus sp. FJAT-45350]|uniref:PepSY domain-containing protein n=1 Tax=Bacillus sp. FJAT-45350 TaxID=2011014 RepID=UPI000BB87A8A|nr:PepSY domain-containing protein [Bacillus sp. FJAT-45350]